MYQRTSKVCTFLRWCLREGHIDRNPAEHLRDADSPLRTFRRTFGKVQSKHPGRWLTHAEAYGQLVGSCQDGTTVGLRDEIVLRLGLAGMRLAEIGGLRVGDVARLPLITWTGKGHTPRRMTAGAGLADAIGRYLDEYPDPATQDVAIGSSGTVVRRWLRPPAAVADHLVDQLAQAVTGRLADLHPTDHRAAVLAPVDVVHGGDGRPGNRHSLCQ